jgi:hypothetical protein
MNARGLMELIVLDIGYGDAHHFADTVLNDGANGASDNVCDHSDSPSGLRLRDQLR